MVQWQTPLHILSSCAYIYIRHTEERQSAERARMEVLLEKERAKEEMRMALGRKIARERQEAEELEAMRIELAEEEQRAKDRERERQEFQVPDILLIHG